MNDDSGRPLPASIEALLQAERNAPAPPAEVSARVFRRLGRTLGAPMAGSGSLLASTKTYLVVAALAAGLAGLGARLGSRPPEGQTVAPAAASAGPPRAAIPTAAPTAGRLQPRAHLPSPGDDLAEQSAQLLSARRALASGQTDRARQMLRVHAHRWPRGALEQEREILMMDTLAASGDQPGARRRADRFLQRFPDSTLSTTARQHAAGSGRAGGGVTQ